ncbi:MAG: hypothetical protein RIS92_1822 [Verrucomicrobiota bacterium]
MASLEVRLLCGMARILVSGKGVKPLNMKYLISGVSYLAAVSYVLGQGFVGLEAGKLLPLILGLGVVLHGFSFVGCLTFSEATNRLNVTLWVGLLSASSWLLTVGGLVEYSEGKSPLVFALMKFGVSLLVSYTSVVDVAAMYRTAGSGSAH